VGGPRTPGGARGPSIKPPSPPDKPRNWKNPFEDDLFERKPPTDRKDKDKSGGNEYLITNKQVAMKTLKITPAMAAVGVGVVVLVLWAILS
jgi:hypothetical protein